MLRFTIASDSHQLYFGLHSESKTPVAQDNAKQAQRAGIHSPSPVIAAEDGDPPLRNRTVAQQFPSADEGQSPVEYAPFQNCIPATHSTSFQRLIRARSRRETLFFSAWFGVYPHNPTTAAPWIFGAPPGSRRHFTIPVLSGLHLWYCSSTGAATNLGYPAMKRSLSRYSYRVPNQSGQAMAEFVLSAVTFLFSILVIIQLALVLNAYTLVRYAAYNAARAGVVHGADPEMMQDAARISLLGIFPRHGRADHVRGFSENYLGAKQTDADPALTPFGEPITDVQILGKDNISCGQTITFDDPAQARDAVITVQVVHRYELVIPLANRIMYWVYTRHRSGEGYQGQSVDTLAKTTDQMRRGGEFNDIEYRLPLVAHYTMRMQSDFVRKNCS